MQSQESQISTIHFLIFSLKPHKEVWDLHSCGEFAHEKGDLSEGVSRPHLNVSFVLYDRIWKFQMLCTFSRERKKEFLIGEAISLIILYFSIISICKFLWWMVYSLHLEIKSWKLLFWSSLIILKALTCNLFIKLLDCLEQKIQTKVDSSWIMI